MPINIAATRRVNPPGVEPLITTEQLWKGLETKVKKPELFVPVATGADLVSEGGKSIRKMNTKDGSVVQESIEAYDNTMLYFDGIDSESRVTNTISYDENDELLLTFSFVGGVPGIPDLGAKASTEELNKVVGASVEKTVDVIREGVKNGEI